MAKQPDSTKPAPDWREHGEFDINENPSQYAAQFQQSIGGSQSANTSGVTIYPAPHLANGHTLYSKESHTAEDILDQILAEKDTRAGLIQSSFQDGADATFSPNANGLVYGAIQAYSQHHHLKIRPEDVWLAILTQLSAYINAHAEELRGSFVAHEGKKELRIFYDYGNRFTVSWTDFSYKIGTMIQDHVVDPELREWMMPAFTTTTSHDAVIASIVMMASMQAYFEYGMSIDCGLPSVTLLGTKADYELILHRLAKLRNYGKEPALFADLLTPILKRFVLSFDEPESDEVKSFWNRIFSQWDMGSGPTYMTGWITAFGFWDADGKCLYSPSGSSWVDEELPPLTLDGMKYATIDREKIPRGFCMVPVDIDDNGVQIDAEMVAGSVGFDWGSSGGEVVEPKAKYQGKAQAVLRKDAGKGSLDTIQPRSGWWVYEKVPEAEVKAKREAEEKRQREEHEKWMEEFRKRKEEREELRKK